MTGILEARRRPEHRRRAPSRIEELVLWHATMEGDRRAADALWSAHQRMVAGIARRYRGQGLDPEDLTAAASVGWWRGVAKFDPARGRLSTVATWWARQAVARAVADTGSTIRVPVNLHGRLKKHRAGKPCGARHETLLAAAEALAPMDSLDQPAGRDDARPLHETIADPETMLTF